MSQVHPEDPKEIARWLNDAQEEGWTGAQSSVKAVLEDPDDPAMWLGWCDSCDKAIASLDALTSTENNRKIVEGYVHGQHADKQLCGECEAGEPGHDAFHKDIDEEERDRHYYARQGARHERRFAHEAFERIAQDEHKECPWAVRGQHCDVVNNIESNETEDAIGEAEGEAEDAASDADDT